MEILNIKKNYMLVSRAATGIFLILKANGIKDVSVMLPANICYAAIYPVIYAGNHPVFCDVDLATGNITYEIVAEKKNNIDVLIAPHMYGNPIKDIDKIAELCRENNILLIEDCASAMGATVKESICGQFGDYAIFSTGYSKTIDVGGGGIIISNRELVSLQKMYEQMPAFNELDEKNEEFFSKFYRLVRNLPSQTLSDNMWKSIQEAVRPVFINYTNQYNDAILEALVGLKQVIGKRRSSQHIYETHIKENDKCRIYQYEAGAVPWRFNLLVDKNYHRTMIDYLLKNNIPVSDWYPISTKIFGNTKEYPNAYAMECQILNFPLLVEENLIKKICLMINEFWTKEGGLL